MENITAELLATLTGSFLEDLPCFYDNPDQIQFRIGLNEGPQIRLYQETQDLYYLFVQDSNERSIHLGIRIDSGLFQNAQDVYRQIRVLCNRNDYKNFDQNSKVIGTMLGNLDRLAKSVLDKVNQ